MLCYYRQNGTHSTKLSINKSNKMWQQKTIYPETLAFYSVAAQSDDSHCNKYYLSFDIS